ncbi:MAG TPA: hypothetical protein VGE51_00615, partial [Fontimonas sp.]
MTARDTDDEREPAVAAPGIFSSALRALRRLLAIASLCLSLAPAPAAAQAQPVRLDDALSAAPIPLAGHLEVFHDASGELSQAQVASAEYATRFKAIPGSFNGGFTPHGAWWVRWRIDT